MNYAQAQTSTRPLATGLALPGAGSSTWPGAGATGAGAFGTGDLISEFMEFTESVLSPDLFRRWSAIGMIAGALERRVWAKVGTRSAFANLYTLLVAPPGVGKQIIDLIWELWAETREPDSLLPAFRVAPASVTSASLVDEILKAKTTRLMGPGVPPEEFCSLLVAAEELQVLLPKFDPEILGRLNKIYNNPPSHAEARRTGQVRDLIIPKPQLNILAGTQPSQLASLLPEEAWGTGLTSRIVMVYSAEELDKDMFSEDGYTDEARARMLVALSRLSVVWGEMEIDDDAQERVRNVQRGVGDPRPGHSKLEHYNRRRGLHAIKLALVSAISRGRRPPQTIELVDVNRAVAWLVEAEALMPDIFRAMVGKSDSQVLEELYYYLLSLWRAAGGKPIHQQRLEQFLAARVPSEKIEKLIPVAERLGLMERCELPATWKPCGRDGGIAVVE